MFELPYEVKLAPWGAAMIKVLDADNRASSEYCDDVRRGRRKPGLLIYPLNVEFA